MKILQASTFLLIFLFSSVKGFSLGVEYVNDSPMDIIVEPEAVPEAQAPEVPASAPTMDVAQNRNLLIIGVNQVTDPIVHLESVWMLIYHRDNPNIEIIPIFPTMSGEDLMRDYTLAANFYFEEGVPSEDFWNALRDRDILWHNFVLLDESALNAITDLLELSRARESGFLYSWQDDPDISLNGQLALFAQLCQSFAQHEFPEDISPFINNLTPYLTTDVPVEEISADWRLLRIYGENLRCEFPTLTASQEY